MIEDCWPPELSLWCAWLRNYDRRNGKPDTIASWWCEWACTVGTY